ncbi:MAG: ABC transporter [Dictyoglomus sp. NZ13-RE01]|nr:MAG: ABC transporter [Dictyoglomus sp. NZ13-RE01]
MISNIFAYLILILFSLISLYPILNVLSVSLRPYNRVFVTSLRIIPEDASLENYYVLFTKRPFLRWMLNSIIVSVSVSIIGVAVASLAAYGFSRFKFIGRQISLLSFLVTQMFPPAMFLIPIYLLLNKFNLLDSFRGLIIPYIPLVLPMAVWILKGYYDSIPIDLEEAARIDGATLLGAFYRIVLPLASPALVITFLFSFMSAWSEYIIARVVLSKVELFTLPLGLANLIINEFQTDWGTYSAGALIVTIPVLIIFLSISKYIVGGLTLGGVTGE